MWCRVWEVLLESEYPGGGELEGKYSEEGYNIVYLTQTLESCQ